MNRGNIIVICFLLIGFYTVNAQNCPIQVKTEIVHSTRGLSNGSISFEVEGQTGSKEYEVFNISSLQEKSNAHSSYKYNDLAAGIYEFIVIARKKEKCIKEVQVKIEQQ